MPTLTQKLARTSEDKVADRWKEQGWNILARNYRGTGFEIDLIAHKKNTVSFIEVKARTQLGVWSLSEFITKKKSASIRRGALHFITHQAPDANHYRFDLCLLTANGKMTVIPDILASD